MQVYIKTNDNINSFNRIMFLASIILCCFIFTIQSQSQYYNPYVNPNQIYFADNLPQVVPLSLNSNAPDQNVIRSIFQDQPKKKKASSVEIERSNELSFGTTVDRAPDKLNIDNKQTSTIIIPSTETARDITFNRQTVPVTPPNASAFNSLLYSVTNFGLNLLKNINNVQSGNAVVSPYSVTSLLAMLQQGAWGQTQEQISNALQMSPETSASLYAQVIGDFKNRNSRNILKSANNLFVADAFTINQDFKSVAIRNFNSDITPVSFSKSDLAARQINSWVASRTNNKIEQLISPDALGPTTQVVLVNAIYFKGLWEVPFRVESTVPREFQLRNGQTKTAQFMRMRKMFKTGVDGTTNAKIIILPFEGDQYSLMVVLPSELVGMTNTLTSLTDARLLSYLSFSAMEAELELPKFTVRSDTDLTPILRNMGITNIFGQYAELNGVGTYRTFSPQISSAVHSAVLSIDEQGGSAAAATAFAAVALSYDEPSVVFKANRPFIAVLWDSKSSLPLFMAKIEDPQF